MTHDEIKQLAHLARIDVSEAEIEGYIKDFDAILGYVEQISQADVSGAQTEFLQTNIAREDENAYEPGQFSDAMLSEAPASQNGFYKVPKIL